MQSLQSNGATRRVSKRKIDEDVTSSKGSVLEEGPDQQNIDPADSIERGRKNKGSNTKIESDNGMRRVSKRKIYEDVTCTKGPDQENTDETNSTEKGRKSRRLDTKMESDSSKSQDSSLEKSSPNKKKLAKNNKKTKINKKNEQEYEVEKVINSKKTKGKLFYLIHWKGYSEDSDSWEPANRLSCPDLIKNFHKEKANSKNKNGETTTKITKKESKKPSKLAKKRKTENDEENAEYEVERILEVHHKKDGKREFLIHWKGWSSKFDSWEPEDNLNCSDLIEKFMNKDPSDGHSHTKAKKKTAKNLNAE